MNDRNIENKKKSVMKKVASLTEAEKKCVIDILEQLVLGRTAAAPDGAGNK